MRLAKGLFVAEPQDRPAQTFKIQLTLNIPTGYIVTSMDATIDFENKPKLCASEITDIVADGMLAAELVAIDLARADQSPDLLLSKAGFLSQVSGDVDAIQSSLFPLTLSRSQSPVGSWALKPSPDGRGPVLFVLTGTWPFAGRCPTCGWRSPTRCRTSSARAPECRR